MIRNFFHSNFKSIKKLFITYTIVMFLVLGGVLLWLMCKTYLSCMEVKRLEMEAAISKIELSFVGMLDYTESVMNHVGKQIGVSRGSEKEVSEILSSFREKKDDEESVKNTLSISMFSWANDKKFVVLNSQYGFMQRPLDISGRDYLQNTIDNPWMIYTGLPVIGVVSGQQIIPAGLGVENIKSKKYLGSIVLGFTVNSLVERLKKITNIPNLDFTILDKDGKVILESTAGIFSEDKNIFKNVAASHIKHSEAISQFSLLALDDSYLIAKRTNKHPYIIITGYENSIIARGLVGALWPYALGFIILSILFFTAWYVLRSKIISPIIQLSHVSRLVAQDRDDEVVMPESNIAEIIELTEQVKLIERYKINLLQAKKSQERFFANMSHELRTPLNGILNFSLMMKKEAFGPLDADYKEMAQDIYSSGSHLLNLVNDILDFSKMDVGKMKLNEEEFDMLEEIRGAIKIISSDASQHDQNHAVKITSEVESGLSKFFGDRRMFKQILLNLLSNASKFVEEGSIKLNLFTDEKKNLALEVRDTGIGIKEEDLSKLVVEFGQVGDGYSRGKRQGSGLGLFLVKKMAELHQGKFEISSVYGEGTVVKIIFPKDRIINS